MAGAERRQGLVPALQYALVASCLAEPETASEWTDGRSLRATGRTAQFATRIKPEYHRKAKMIAARDGITLAELFGKGVDAYEREQQRS